MKRNQIREIIINHSQVLKQRQNELISEQFKIKSSDIAKYKKLGTTIERLNNLHHLMTIGTL